MPGGWQRCSIGVTLALLLAGCGVLPTPVARRAPATSASTTSSPTVPRDLASGARETVGALPRGQTAAPDEELRSELGGPDDAYTMDVFLTYVLEDVDRYWSGVWSAAGHAEPQVGYVFPGPAEPVSDACSQTGIAASNAAAYCPLDDKIVVTQAFAQEIWNGRVRANSDPSTGQATGDFSVAYVVAHEYAHSLQAELGLIRTSEDTAALFPTYKTELHADCWAGVWANSAYYTGKLEPGDVEEAIATAALIGDYAFAEEGHHGTPAERQNAFTTGYTQGVPAACDVFLTSDY
jgi:predicted metalloprotease